MDFLCDRQCHYHSLLDAVEFAPCQPAFGCPPCHMLSKGSKSDHRDFLFSDSDPAKFAHELICLAPSETCSAATMEEQGNDALAVDRSMAKFVKPLHGLQSNFDESAFQIGDEQYAQASACVKLEHETHSTESHAKTPIDDRVSTSPSPVSTSPSPVLDKEADRRRRNRESSSRSYYKRKIRIAQLANDVSVQRRRMALLFDQELTLRETNVCLKRQLLRRGIQTMSKRYKSTKKWQE